jgi:hypothetical protein
VFQVVDGVADSHPESEDPLAVQPRREQPEEGGHKNDIRQIGRRHQHDGRSRDEQAPSLVVVSTILLLRFEELLIESTAGLRSWNSASFGGSEEVLMAALHDCLEKILASVVEVSTFGAECGEVEHAYNRSVTGL